MAQLQISKIEKSAGRFADPSGGTLVVDCYTITVCDEQGTIGVISLFDRSKAIAAREAIAWAVAEGDWRRSVGQPLVGVATPGYASHAFNPSERLLSPA